MFTPKTAPPPRTMPIPREHGAWGLLLQPFLAAAILAGFWHWLLIPTLGLVVLGFMLKEPLLILSRQRWVWRSLNPQTPIAWRWLGVELVGISICLAVLSLHVPIAPFAVLAAVALALTLTAVWFALKNKQRSLFLQLLSAGGLSSSAILVALVSEQRIPGWSWQLWTILTLHAAAAILVVHARLELIAGRRTSAQPKAKSSRISGSAALLAQLVQVAAAMAAVFAGFSHLAFPLAFSAIANGTEIYRLRRPSSLEEPLKRVGFRTLGISLVHMLISIGAIWQIARP